MSARTRSSFASSRGQRMRQKPMNWNGPNATSPRSGVDPNVSGLAELAAKTFRQLGGALLGHRSDRHVSPTTLRGQTLLSKASRETPCAVPRPQLDDDVPVVLALDLGLALLGRFSLVVLAFLLCRRARERQRRIPPLLRHWMPARHADVGGEPFVADELAHDAFRLTGLRLGRRVGEDPATVACHDDASAEALACLVVQVQRAEALAQRVTVRLVVQVDLDAKVLRHGRGRYQRLGVSLGHRGLRQAPPS